jgi:hypothetical protein
MGVGESIFHHLLAKREAKRQYRFDFMPPASDAEPHTVTVEVGEATVHVVAEDFGRQGVLLESLCLTGLNGHETEDPSRGLMRLVERIVTEVECPYGPIKCIENDEGLTCAVLRTDPAADGCFFEVIVEGGTVAEMKHYTISEFTRERRRTPVNLGRRVFEKMADGLAGAFREEHAAEPV